MSDFKELKAEYVRLAGKNPPPMSADALRAKIDELKASAEQSAESGAAPQPPTTDGASGEASNSDANPAEHQTETQGTVPTPPPAPAQEPNGIAVELEELGLVMDAEGNVGLVMTAGLSGPDICLSPKDSHICPAREAVSLVRAGFATAAAQ